jgi:hypothetical protein
MTKVSLALFLIVLAPAPATAAPQTRDLGLGLVYSRARSIPGDLPPAASVCGHPCVLDLRYASGDRAAGAALDAWLRIQCSLRTPVFLLANAGTSPALLAGLGPSGRAPGLVTLGAAGAGFQPDIPLRVSPAAERRAYEALDKGAPIESLLGENPDKPRNDEARLAREHISDSAPDDDDADTAALTSAPEPPPPLVDAALQRAVHLHRALLALRRL